MINYSPKDCMAIALFYQDSRMPMGSVTLNGFVVLIVFNLSALLKKYRKLGSA